MLSEKVSFVRPKHLVQSPLLSPEAGKVFLCQVCTRTSRRRRRRLSMGLSGPISSRSRIFAIRADGRYSSSLIHHCSGGCGRPLRGSRCGGLTGFLFHRSDLVLQSVVSLVQVPNRFFLSLDWHSAISSSKVHVIFFQPLLQLPLSILKLRKRHSTHVNR